MDCITRGPGLKEGRGVPALMSERNKIPRWQRYIYAGDNIYHLLTQYTGIGRDRPRGSDIHNARNITDHLKVNYLSPNRALWI